MDALVKKIHVSIAPTGCAWLGGGGEGRSLAYMVWWPAAFLFVCRWGQGDLKYNVNNTKKEVKIQLKSI